MTRGFTVESIVAAASDADESGSLPLPGGSPRRPLGPLGGAVVGLRESAIEAVVRYADSVRRGFASPLLRLSQRNQMLLERQLAHLDGFEDNEGDPDVLERLFRLDQLATEMRRTNEGLGALIGVRPAGDSDGTSVELLDVVRGAASAVDGYARVRTRVSGGTLVAGGPANDLACLLAELIDNACRFSLPDSPVEVRGVRTARGMTIVVRDEGPGMVEGHYTELNDLLTQPPLIDRVSGSAGLGLVIASHLAARLGVSVLLRPGSPRGVVATITLPPSLLVDEDPGSVPMAGTPSGEASLPMMVAQLRRRDRLASREGVNNGSRNGMRNATSDFSGDPVTGADLEPVAVDPFEPLANRFPPEIPTERRRPSQVRREANAPVFNMADTGAGVRSALLQPMDELAAQGLVRRVPKASLQQDPYDDARAASLGDAGARPSPEEIRQLFASRQEGRQRAKWETAPSATTVWDPEEETDR
jgi:hypothetical protein